MSRSPRLTDEHRELDTRTVVEKAIAEAKRENIDPWAETPVHPSDGPKYRSTESTYGKPPYRPLRPSKHRLSPAKA